MAEEEAADTVEAKQITVAANKAKEEALAASVVRKK